MSNKYKTTKDKVAEAKEELLSEIVLIYATLKARKLGLFDGHPKDVISDGALLFLKEQIKELAVKHGISLKNFV